MIDDHPFALCLTHDVDRPYKTYQSVYYALADRDPRQLQSLFPGRNPYWQFERLMEIEDSLGVRSAFYFLDEQHLLRDRPVRDWFEPTDPENVPDGDAGRVAETVDATLEACEAAGATLVDPVTVVDDDDLADARVVGNEFKRDVDRYLAEIGDAASVDSLAELVETGTMAPSIEDRIRDLGILDVDVDGLREDPDYLRALVQREVMRTETIDRLVVDDLDAVAYPPATVPPVRMPELQPFEEMRCELAAHTGLPAVVVQAGFAGGVPVGVELLGRPFDERRLLELAYAVEQETDHRRPPEGFD